MKRVFLVLTFISLMITIASAADLTWQELLRRPEFWPKQCTLKKSFDFQSGKGVKAGQTLNIDKITAKTVEVSTTDGLGFDVKPDDTDALAVARDAWNKLTPAQRELTYASVLQRKDLWPYRVNLTQTFDLGRGVRVKKGDAVILMGVTKGELSVITEKTSTGFEVSVQDTDLLDQARKYVDDKNRPPSRVAEEFKGRLVKPASGEPTSLNTNALPRYYMIYRGGGWCPYTRGLTPDVVKFYNDMKPTHPEFETIYIPVDKSLPEMQAYAKQSDFPWPAVAFNRSRDFRILAPLLGPVPQLLIVDSSGKVLFDAAVDTAPATLKQFQALLEKPVAQK